MFVKNVLTYTFDQINSSLINKCINFFKKKDPALLNADLFS